MNLEVLAIISLGFVLGARHAIDWDHIAAITDFVGAEKSKKKGFLLSFYYIIGHALVNLFFGGAAIVLGQSVPSWIDTIMERVVGATLIILGLWIIVILIQNRKGPIFINRWQLLFNVLQKGYYWLKVKITGKASERDLQPIALGPGSACGVGIIHGIGGETASQILLFTTAAGAGTITLGLTAVFAFISGLFSCQIIMVLFLLNGYGQATRNPKVYRGLAIATSLYSIAVGTIFLLGASDLLPPLEFF